MGKYKLKPNGNKKIRPVMRQAKVRSFFYQLSCSIASLPPAGATDLSSVQGNNTHDELGERLLCVTNEAEGRPACVSVCPLACQYYSVCSARA